MQASVCRVQKNEFPANIPEAAKKTAEPEIFASEIHPFLAGNNHPKLLEIQNRSFLT